MLTDTKKVLKSTHPSCICNQTTWIHLYTHTYPQSTIKNQKYEVQTKAEKNSFSNVNQKVTAPSMEVFLNQNALSFFINPEKKHYVQACKNFLKPQCDKISLSTFTTASDGIFFQPKSTINVLKFQTLYSILFWPKFCFVCSCLLKYLVEWQTV